MTLRQLALTSSWLVTPVLLTVVSVLSACNEGTPARGQTETTRITPSSALGPTTSGPAAGATTTESYGDRDLLLHTPPSSTLPTQGVPLVVVLHGGGGNAKWMHEHLDLDSTADRDGLLVAYLEGTPGERRLTKNMRTWNAGTCCGAASKTNADDSGYVLGFIQSMIDRRRADPRRIYLIGHSNGAMMSYRLACEHPETFAAVVVVSGSLLVDSCKASTGLALLHVHGLADDHVPVAGGLGQAAVTRDMSFRSVADSAQMLRAAGATVDVVLVKDGPHAIAGLSDALKTQTSSTLVDTAAAFFKGKTRAL